MTGSDFEQRAIQPLRRLLWRLRAYLLLEGLGVVLLVALGAAVLQLLLDRALHLGGEMRAALLLLAIVAVLLVSWRRVVLPQTADLSVGGAARLVERRFPELRSLLLSAVCFHHGTVGGPSSNSPELTAAVRARAGEAVAGLPLTAVLDHRRARRSTGLALTVVATFTLAFALAPELMGIWFDRSVLLGDTPWPKKTRIVVEVPHGVLHGARGDDLEVRAYVPSGYEAPRVVDIVFASASGRTGRDQMVRVGDRGYRYSFPRVTEDFEFFLEGGDDRTDLFRVELADRPRVDRAELAVTPPAYTGLERYVLPDDRRSVALLPGSELVLGIQTNKPVTRATLMAGEEQIADALGNGAAWRIALRPDRTRTVHFALVDEAGLENRRPVRFAVRMLKDRPPQARVRLAGAGDLVTTDAVLPVELTLSDDYGLATADLVYTIGREGQLEHPVEIPGFRPGLRRHQERVDLPVAALAVLPGDRIGLFARATDADDVQGPNVTRSTAVTLEVVSRHELLAELARREQDYRRDFQRAVEAQEELRRRLLSALARLDDPEQRQETLRRLAAAERRQRQLAGQVNGVRQQFEQLLARMRVNRLDSDAVRRRLGEGVIAPLTELARRRLPAAADELRRLARAASPERASRIDPQQAEAVAAMRVVLDNMLRWEGYQEAVTTLREILRLQRELNAETEQEIERQAGDVFGDE